jgi:hypothetical protein
MENPTTEAAIRAMMDAYLCAYQDLDVEQTRQFYAIPSALVLPDKLSSFHSASDLQALLTQLFSGLKAKAYARSRWAELYVHPLGAMSALVSAIIERFDANGVVIERIGGTYWLLQQAGDWKIAAAGAHSDAFVVR